MYRCASPISYLGYWTRYDAPRVGRRGLVLIASTTAGVIQEARNLAISSHPCVLATTSQCTCIFAYPRTSSTHTKAFNYTITNLSDNVRCRAQREDKGGHPQGVPC